MRQKQKNLKPTLKKKTKTLQLSVLPRLDGPKVSSKESKVKVTRSKETFLPTLETSAKLKEKHVNGNSKHKKLNKINLYGSLPNLNQQKKSKKILSSKKGVLKEDISHGSECSGEFNKVTMSKFETSTRKALRENVLNKNYGESLHCQKQKKCSDACKNDFQFRVLKKRKDYTKNANNTAERSTRPRQFNLAEAETNLSKDCDLAKQVEKNRTTKNLKQVNLHFTPIVANDSSKENASQPQAQRIHLRKYQRKPQRPSVETSLDKVENPDRGLEEESNFQMDSGKDEPIFELYSDFAFQDIFKGEHKINKEANGPNAITNIANCGGIKESGPMNSPESGSSELATNPDEGFCEQDIIFEEVIRNVNQVNSQRIYCKGNPKSTTQQKSISHNFTKRLEKLQSELDWRKIRGSILSTKQFQVEGLEVALKTIPPKRKPKNISMSNQKPRIPRDNGQVRNDCSVQGHKVKGSCVDIDDYVIDMVRFVNCNDKSLQDDWRDFPDRFFLWSP